jgi:tryptophan synthase beta chain
MGIFSGFLDDAAVALVGCEAGGDGIETGRHAAPLTAGTPGVLHGARSYLMQDQDGQTLDTHSISAGLDYPGVGPEHAWLRDAGRASYRGVTDTDAMDALALLAKTEGILCAIESAHAFAGALQWVREQQREDLLVLVNCSGRGDKDVDTAGRYFGLFDA